MTLNHLREAVRIRCDEPQPTDAQILSALERASELVNPMGPSEMKRWEYAVVRLAAETLLVRP